MDNIFHYYSGPAHVNSDLAAFCPHRRDIGRGMRTGKSSKTLRDRLHGLGSPPDHGLEWA